MGLEPDHGRDGLWSLRYWRGLLGSARPRHDQKQFTALLIGEDPLNVDKLYKKLLLRSGGNGPIAGVAITSASGIEIVLRDLADRILQTSVCNLIGGRFRDRVRF